MARRTMEGLATRSFFRRLAIWMTVSLNNCFRVKISFEGSFCWRQSLELNSLSTL